MFGSTVLDVVTGLVFVFMAVSLAASALTEALSSLLKLRQRTLVTGVQALLNDPDFTGLAKQLYNHALVNPLADGVATSVEALKAKPAYIDSSRFALALVSVLQRPDPTRPLSDTIAAIPNQQLKQTLTDLLTTAENDKDAFLKAVGDWFDDAMDRVTGWYKRYTQIIGFGMALFVCVVLNADALRIGAALWNKPTLVAELSAKDLPAPGSTDAHPSAEAQLAIAKLDQAGLMGWTGTIPNGPGEYVSMVLGWLIVAGASLFGAPFWFDLLQRVASLAGVGPGGRDDTPAAPQNPVVTVQVAGAPPAEPADPVPQQVDPVQQVNPVQQVDPANQGQ